MIKDSSRIFAEAFEWVYELIYHNIYHVLVLVGIITLVAIVKLSSNILETAFESIKHFLASNILKLRIFLFVKKLKKKNRKGVVLKEDIEKNILLLNHPENQYTAIQFLFLYPSPNGLRALLNFAIDENDKSKREYIVCLLCASLKSGTWVD